MNSEIEKFEKEGYIEPFKIINNDDCKKILYDSYIPRKYYTWAKSIHEKSVEVKELATNSEILNKIKKIIGNDILLWGSCFIKQEPGNKHSWHCDLEYENWDGITIWIGLKNLNKKTELSLITHTHTIDTFPQKLSEKNIDLNNNNEVLYEAKKINPNCELKTFILNEGEAIIWSGRVWHKTENLSQKPRESIILQYSTPNNIIKIPEKYDYKNMRWLNNSPPCLLISGKDRYKKNKVIDLSNKRINSSVISFLIKRYFFIRYNLSYMLKKILKE